MVKQGYSRGRYAYNRRPGSKYRKNERIRVPEVRLINAEGTQVGIVSTRDALSMAKKAGLDLVEVSPVAKPPVCRILDFGKFMYEESKKSKKSTKSTASKLKEIKFRLNIDQHDYVTKVRHAEEFLSKGFKVKLTLMFRRRELSYKDLGFKTILRAIEDLEGMATKDNEPKLIGLNITLTVSPLPAYKRKPKYYVPAEVEAPKSESETST